MAQKKFNSLNWYKRTVKNKKINRKNSKSLLGFLLIWSALENLYFENDNHRTPMADRLFELGKRANEITQQSEYLSFIHHFQERYFGANQDGERLFYNLFLGTQYEELVRNVVRDCKPTENIIPALLLIANRYRNNFIHGRKEPIKVHEYEKQFNILNQFLSKFIERTEDLRRIQHG